mmetsp:Transcript_115931/g.322827  ORF Transcript_115931/g.322827 Transcript_115931/m.322827 type:complete len:207 (+) Transcript_115931:304-924(+)
MQRTFCRVLSGPTRPCSRGGGSTPCSIRGGFHLRRLSQSRRADCLRSRGTAGGRRARAPRVHRPHVGRRTGRCSAPCGCPRHLRRTHRGSGSTKRRPEDAHLHALLRQPWTRHSHSRQEALCTCLGRALGSLAARTSRVARTSPPGAGCAAPERGSHCCWRQKRWGVRQAPCWLPAVGARGAPPRRPDVRRPGPHRWHPRLPWISL